MSECRWINRSIAEAGSNRGPKRRALARRLAAGVQCGDPAARLDQALSELGAGIAPANATEARDIVIAAAVKQRFETTQRRHVVAGSNMGDRPGAVEGSQRE
jgi:hypothetical protein